MFCCGWYIVVPSVVRKLIIEIIECQGLQYCTVLEAESGHLRGAGSRRQKYTRTVVDYRVPGRVVESTVPGTPLSKVESLILLDTQDFVSSIKRAVPGPMARYTKGDHTVSPYRPGPVRYIVVAVLTQVEGFSEGLSA